MYRLKETKDVKQDIRRLAAYMVFSLKNIQAAGNLFDQYEKQVQSLTTFPYRHRKIGVAYQGHEIRIKPFSTYNIFFIVDENRKQITILRVLKDRQDWKSILHNGEYHF